MRVSIRQSAIALIFASLLVFSVRAEIFNSKFLQTQWTTENGLPQNSVTSIAQTRDGYLWLGTFGGLARFDGVRFKIYTTANTPELRSNRITALGTDHQKTLWIGTENGEIVCYSNGKFKLIDDGKQTGNGAVTEFFADREDVMLTGTSAGLQICSRNNCRRGNFAGTIHRIRKDENGDLWILSEKRLFQKRGAEFVGNDLVAGEVIAFEPHPKGGFWIVKADEIGVYVNGEYKTLGKLKMPTGYTGTIVAPDGAFWINVKNHLYRVKDDEFEVFEIRNVEGATTRKIFVDQEGNLWLGRVGDGLFRLLNRRVQTLAKENGFRNVAVNSIAEDRDGGVWLATNQGLFRWTNGETALIPAENQTGEWLRGALLFDRGGTLWNGTSEGLQSIRDGKFTLHKEISWDKAASGNSLFEDGKKNLWYGCQGCGVFVFDGKNVIARYTKENGLVGSTVNFIHESADGAIWLATRNGISRLQDGKFTNYTSADGLSNEYVRDIHEDADGTLWFGTYGGGLNRFKNGKFTPVTTGDGLFDDIVSRILTDDDDNFWMLGNRGIFSVSRQMLNDFADGKINQIYCSAYTTADGMITSEGNGGYQWAGTRARDGRLWFPMINGVVIVDPKQEKLPPPEPLIEEVFLNGQEVDALQKVEINPGNESLEINYTGMSFRKPEQIRFRYRLAGLDEKWTEAGTRRLANYPYLPSGNYRFQLSAANANGVWSEKFAELEIEVFPPFWKTWWFTALVLLTGALILYAVYKYRNWNFAREKAVREEFARRLLNAQETERRRIASEIHDNLGQQLLIIKNWAAYCSGKISKTSVIREQLAQIGETADEALNEVRLMAKNLSPYHLDKAGLTNTIGFMVKQVAESGDIAFHTEIDDINGVLSKDGEINLYRIVQEAVNNIIKHSRAKNANVIIKHEENILRLTIADDGEGFQPGESVYRELGMGLNGITERAKMLGGNLTVKSAPKNGTQIVLEIGI